MSADKTDYHALWVAGLFLLLIGRVSQLIEDALADDRQ